MNESAQPVPPSGFWQHVRSLGPGLVVALTWLGAGDLVGSAVAGGSYGYGLMWAMVIALVVRFFFVSIIAKYQLCNQHGESVVSGLKRVHPWLPLFVGVVALFFGHFYGSYMVKGVGDRTLNRINHELLMRVREADGREASPSAGVIDSQSVKTTESGGPRGFNAGKKINAYPDARTLFPRSVCRDNHSMICTSTRAKRLEVCISLAA